MQGKEGSVPKVRGEEGEGEIKRRKREGGRRVELKQDERGEGPFL